MRKEEYNMNKTWKSLNIPNTASRYLISNDGIIVDETNGIKMNKYHSSNGYDFVPIAIDENTNNYIRLFDVGLLVCSTFNDVPKKLIGKELMVHYLNGNLRDCTSDNLVWRESVEIWRTVTYPNIKLDTYEVSSYGRLRTKATGKIYMGKAPNSRGYIIAHLKNCSGGIDSFQIHRLIAWEFLPDTRDMSKEVNHINGIKTNNYYTNLEWVTHDENMRHAYSLNMIYRPHGENCYKAKITNDLVHYICKLFILHYGNSNNVYKQLKEEGYDITLRQIQHIKHKECWDWISDQYWTNQYLIDLHIMKINMICKELVKQKGDTLKTLEVLITKIPYLSKRFIEVIKYKEAYSDISDIYFTKNGFK